MKFVAIFWEAIRNLLSAKLRSFLAVLGIIVGTGSVVALITCSQLATEHVLQQFKKLGTKILAVSINNPSNLSAESHKFSLSDVSSLNNQIDNALSISPYTINYRSITDPVMQNSAFILGVTDNFFNITKIKLFKGRYISLLDKLSFFCVIGRDIAKQLTQHGIFNPIGSQIKLGDWYFTIVGVVKNWKPNPFLFLDVNNAVLIPIETSLLISNSSSIDNLLIKLPPRANVLRMQSVVHQHLQKMLPNYQIEIRNPTEIINIIKENKDTLNWLLIAIASISLLVGGIGVMNIMLVSVVERRCEIGVRLAIGARPIDILKMFLIEAVILSLLGGLLGVMLGSIFSYILAAVLHWSFDFYLWPTVLGFFVSGGIGIVSGFYPAWRASRLNPISSLRYN